LIITCNKSYLFPHPEQEAEEPDEQELHGLLLDIVDSPFLVNTVM
jgi:hypothetical protein